MIQFNLLPDVKLEYIKAQRLRRLMLSISTIVTIAAVVIMVLLFVAVDVAQKKHLKDLSRDVTTYSKKLQDTKDLNKILTVQNQLSALTNLHEAKPAATRLFDYLNLVTPNSADINNFAVDFGAHTVTITGTADSLATVNQYIDTLKYSLYVKGDPSIPADATCANYTDPRYTLTDTLQRRIAAACKESKNESVIPVPDKLTDLPYAFSAVVMQSFGRSDRGASYTITLNYDPTIFDITQAIRLIVPKKVTTRANLDAPKQAQLFRQPAQTDTQAPNPSGAGE